MIEILPQFRGELEPVHAVRQIVVGKDEVRSDRAARHKFQRCDAVRRGCHAMALVLENHREEVAHIGLILDDQDHAGAASSFSISVIHALKMKVSRRSSLTGCEHDLDGEDGTLAQMRADAYPVAEQTSQAMDDGEAEAEATGPLARGVVEQIGRAHVWTPVTNAQLVCRLLHEKKTKPSRQHTANH